MCKILLVFIVLFIFFECNSLSSDAKSYIKIAIKTGENYLDGTLDSHKAQVKINDARTLFEQMDDFHDKERYSEYSFITFEMILLNNEISLHASGSATKDDVQEKIKALKKYI